MRLGRSIVGVFSSNLISLFLSLGNSIFLTRVLGVEGRGEFAIFSASFGLLTMLLGLEVHGSVRYFVAKGSIPRERILSSLLVFALAVGVVAFGLAHLSHKITRAEIFLPLSKQSVPFELVLAGVVMANLVYGNIASVFAGHRAFRTLNLTSVGLAGLSLLIFGSLFGAQASGRWAVSTGDVFLVYLGLQSFNAVLLTGLAYRKLGLRVVPRLLETGLLANLSRYAGLAYVATLLQFLNYRLDIWIVQYFSGSGQLGLYALAATLATMPWMLSRAMATVLMPSMTADGATDFGKAARLARLSLLVTVLLAIPLGGLAGWWVPLLYGEEFTGAVQPIRILLLGCAPFAMCVVQAAALGARARLMENLTASGAGLIVTVALDLVLIPRYGIHGAAAASAASYLVTMLMVLRAFSTVGEIPLREALVPRLADVRHAIDGLKNVLR